ncbi:uncharacterized protein LOC126764167 isoform X1 [Bactrocera neohumeralis]|uniref:uncharacterized protein LOC126764167 isoform X1 n=1 Tax=Bactrocera neohumeralis TaxID=98809 RepID=UPI0021655996|nr:uncharacterized protein LOC126764167 isoform X1 [Bactrocera neohumeralis]
MGSIDRACISGFLCRLCSEMHRIVIHIYGDQGRKLCLVEKINGYLPITISPTDPLPKTICETCLRRVEQHYDLLMRLTRIKQGNFPKIKKDSRATEHLYVRKEWQSRTQYEPGQQNVSAEPLVNPQDIFLPPLHIKLGLIKNFVKALNSEEPAFQYLTQQALRTIGDVSSTDVSDDEHFDLTISQEARNSIRDTNVLQLSTDVSSQSSLIGTMQATTEYISHLP